MLVDLLFNDAFLVGPAAAQQKFAIAHSGLLSNIGEFELQGSPMVDRPVLLSKIVSFDYHYHRRSCG